MALIPSNALETLESYFLLSETVKGKIPIPFFIVRKYRAVKNLDLMKNDMIGIVKRAINITLFCTYFVRPHTFSHSNNL